MAKPLRALVVANGVLPEAKLVRERAALADLVVAADGGADGALACGVTPNAVVGDLDSVSTAARDLLGPERLHRDADPERTDLQKALAFALRRGAQRVDVVGWAGGRVDHFLANLSILVLTRGQADVRLIDDHFEVRLVAGRTTVSGVSGTVVSLVAIGRCEGVTLTTDCWSNARSKRLRVRAAAFCSRGIGRGWATAMQGIVSASREPS